MSPISLGHYDFNTISCYLLTNKKSCCYNDIYLIAIQLSTDNHIYLFGVECCSSAHCGVKLQIAL